MTFFLEFSVNIYLLLFQYLLTAMFWYTLDKWFRLRIYKVPTKRNYMKSNILTFLIDIGVSSNNQQVTFLPRLLFFFFSTSSYYLPQSA